MAVRPGSRNSPRNTQSSDSDSFQPGRYTPAYQPRRVQEEELLDAIPASEAVPNMVDLARINRWLGGYSVLRSAIRKVSGASHGLRVLDVAAASTATADWLRDAIPGASITSSDIRHDLLALGNGDRAAADATRLPFRSGSFDVVICTLFLHHLSEAALLSALREMHRVSRYGVVAVDLQRHFLAYHFLRMSHPFLRWHPVTLEDGRRSVQAAFTAQELRDLVQQAGFADSKVRAHLPWFRLSVVIPKRGESAAA